MLLRILTALVLIPPVFYLIAWAPDWLFLLGLVLTVERGLYEYFSMSRQAGFRVFPAIGYVAGALIAVAQFVELRDPGRLGGAVLLVLILFTLVAALHSNLGLEHYQGAVASTVLGVLYVGFMLSWLVPIRFSGRFDDFASGDKLMILLFLIIWAGDISAYFVGRSMGRTLLIPRVSPKKTVEGAVAGFVGSLLVAGAYSHWFLETASMKTVILLASLVAMAGQIGDLVESAMKRGANVKDSGAILPGHGGLLDRIDSLVLGAPTLWLALNLKDLW